MPIASLPMLNGKMYVVWDGSLVQSIYRNRDLSFGPFVMDFAQRMLDYDDEADKMVRGPKFLEEFVASNHEGMSGSNVHRMNANALKYVAAKLHEINDEDGLSIPNLFLWTRDIMTEATCEALYGPANPLKKDRGLIDDLWLVHCQMLKRAFTDAIAGRSRPNLLSSYLMFTHQSQPQRLIGRGIDSKQFLENTMPRKETPIPMPQESQSTEPQPFENMALQEPNWASSSWRCFMSPQPTPSQLCSGSSLTSLQDPISSSACTMKRRQLRSEDLMANS